MYNEKKNPFHQNFFELLRLLITEVAQMVDRSTRMRDGVRIPVSTNLIRTSSDSTTVKRSATVVTKTNVLGASRLNELGHRI